VAVEGEGLRALVEDVLDDLDLELLAELLEELQCLLARDLLAQERQVLANSSLAAASIFCRSSGVNGSLRKKS